MNEEQFSPEQSLRVIQSMIQKARQDFSLNAFFYLLWGWLIFTAAIVQYLMIMIWQSPYHYMAWMLMWVGAIVSIIYGFRMRKKERVKTYMSESMNYFGIGTGISFGILSFVFSYYKAWPYAFPVYLVLYGYGSFVSGSILRFVPLRWAAAVCWLIAGVSVFVSYGNQLLLMALAVLAAYIIPGYLLKEKDKKKTN